MASFASFGALLQAVDIHNRTVTFCHNGSSTKVDYDLLIGADGVNSKVRYASLLPGVSRDCSSQRVSQLRNLDTAACELQVLPSRPFMS